MLQKCYNIIIMCFLHWLLKQVTVTTPYKHKHTPDKHTHSHTQLMHAQRHGTVQVVYY